MRVGQPLRLGAADGSRAIVLCESVARPSRAARPRGLGRPARRLPRAAADIVFGPTIPSNSYALGTALKLGHAAARQAPLERRRRRIVARRAILTARDDPEGWPDHLVQPDRAAGGNGGGGPVADDGLMPLRRLRQQLDDADELPEMSRQAG